LRHDVIEPAHIISEIRNRSDDDFGDIYQLLLAAVDHLFPLVEGKGILCSEFFVGRTYADDDVSDPLLLRLFDAIDMSAMQSGLATGDEKSCLCFHGHMVRELKVISEEFLFSKKYPFGIKCYIFEECELCVIHCRTDSEAFHIIHFASISIDTDHDRSPALDGDIHGLRLDDAMTEGQRSQSAHSP
jgi:hypothetical protein